MYFLFKKPKKVKKVKEGIEPSSPNLQSGASPKMLLSLLKHRIKCFKNKGNKGGVKL